MGWLDNLEYDYLYVCATCGGETIATAREDACPCAHEGCGGTAGFVKMIPMELGLSGKVAFEQNGRKAFMIQGKKGRKPTYISATKMHYLDTGEIKPHYTKEYEAHVGKQSPEFLEGDTNMNRAKATPHRVHAPKKETK
jgi:hypothetical protein